MESGWRISQGHRHPSSVTLLRLLVGLFVANVSGAEGKEAVGWQDISPGQWTDVKALHRFPSILVCISPAYRGQRAQVLSPCCLFQQLASFFFIARKHLFIVRALFWQPFQKLAIIISHNVDCYFVPMRDHNDFDISILPYSRSSIALCQSFCQSSTNRR